MDAMEYQHGRRSHDENELDEHEFIGSHDAMLGKELDDEMEEGSFRLAHALSLIDHFPSRYARTIRYADSRVRERGR